MLPGLRAALNYHPIFVHFPIVLWLAALLFELLAIWRASDDMQRTATRMLYLGTLAALVTIPTGLAAIKSIPPGDAQRVVGIHETLMLVVTSLALALSLFALVQRNTFTPEKRKILLGGLFLLAILLAREQQAGHGGHAFSSSVDQQAGERAGRAASRAGRKAQPR